MNKKAVACFTLMAFIVFTASCIVRTYKKQRAEDIVGIHGIGNKILAVSTTSGEHIEFPKEHPGRISGTNIVGIAESEELGGRIELNKTDIEKIKRSYGKIDEILTIEGKWYKVIPGTVKKKKDGIIFSYYKGVSIPLSEVELAWVKKVDIGLTFVAVVGEIGLACLGVLTIIAMLKESCPFIYSFDGKQYIFDSEPYGGAICEGLKRTEWCRLEHLKAVNGQYKIMVTNEVNETQYTDEIRLLIVDHPQGTKIVPDINGGMHTFLHPLSPYKAYDDKERDLMPYISENDWIFWQTSLEGKNPDRREDLRDDLYFEFPKPRDAASVKLLVNACTTLWGSQMLKQFLDLFGSQVNEWYDEINKKGPAYYRLMELKSRAERYLLNIRVETEEGWETKGQIIGGGPFVSEDKAYLLDISDVPGDMLKIKLTPPATFWMINYLAVDYSQDLPIEVTELGPFTAVDWRDEDVRETLSYNDNHYLVMPNIGDKAELTFQSIPPIPGMERSLVLKASGYYDIHLKKEGERNNEVLLKFLMDPEYMNQYALEKYLEWKKESKEKLRLN
jgi:hypothetical protein